MTNTAQTLIIPHFFGTEDVGAYLGLQKLSGIAGTTAGMLLIGAAPDLLGSYAAMLRLLAPLTLGMAGALCTLRSPLAEHAAAGPPLGKEHDREPLRRPLSLH